MGPRGRRRKGARKLGDLSSAQRAMQHHWIVESIVWYFSFQWFRRHKADIETRLSLFFCLLWAGDNRVAARGTRLLRNPAAAIVSEIWLPIVPLYLENNKFPRFSQAVQYAATARPFCPAAPIRQSLPLGCLCQSSVCPGDGSSAFCLFFSFLFFYLFFPLTPYENKCLR